MAYIKNELHFINYCCKKIRDFGIGFKNHEKFVGDLKEIYQLSEEIRHLTYGRTLVDVITWQLYQKISKEEILDFLYKEMKEIIKEATSVYNKEIEGQTFKYLNPIKKNQIIRYKEIEIDFPKQISNEALQELAKLKNCYGIYFIYNSKNQLIYIGKSKNLGGRIPASIRERGGRKFSYILSQKPADIHILEPYLILKYKPLKNSEFMEYGDTSFEIKIPPMSKIITFYQEEEEENGK